MPGPITSVVLGPWTTLTENIGALGTTLGENETKLSDNGPITSAADHITRERRPARAQRIGCTGDGLSNHEIADASANGNRSAANSRLHGGSPRSVAASIRQAKSPKRGPAGGPSGSWRA